MFANTTREKEGLHKSVNIQLGPHLGQGVLGLNIDLVTDAFHMPPCWEPPIRGLPHGQPEEPIVQVILLGFGHPGAHG